MTDLLKGNRKVLISVLDDDGKEKLSMDFDCVENEDHTQELMVTEHPAEDGSVFTDHMVQSPDSLTMDILLTDHPYLDTESYIVIGNNIANNLLKALTSTDEETRSLDGYVALKQLQRNKTLLRVHTPLEIYDNMVLVNISTPRDYKTVHSLKSTLTFREVRLVQSQTTSVPDKYLEKSSKNSTSSKKVKGRKTTKKPTDSDSTKLKSNLKVWSNYFK